MTAGIIPKRNYITAQDFNLSYLVKNQTLGNINVSCHMKIYKQKSKSLSMENEFDFSKGQYMLVDKSVVALLIKESNLQREDSVLEIGAGDGILTEQIARACKDVTVFELDRRFEENLAIINQRYPQIKFLFEDCLHYSWRGCTKLVANIPYHLSEAIILRAIKFGIKDCILIVGEKFKEKLETNTKIGLISRLFYSLHALTIIRRNSFDPPPRTNSWLIHLKKKDEINLQDAILLNICLSNGKIKNALVSELVRKGLTKREAKESLSKAKLNKLALEKPAFKITAPLFGLLKESVEKLCQVP